ncbi:MAG: hypothetical protein ACLQF1_19755 [Methyloceanibacter sp.]|jgi:hypothetical protein
MGMRGPGANPFGKKAKVTPQHKWPPLHAFDDYYDLTLGPRPGFDEAYLRQAWEHYRDELMADPFCTSPGRRPWAYWYFDVDPGKLPPRLRRLTELKRSRELGEEALRLLADENRQTQAGAYWTK